MLQRARRPYVCWQCLNPALESALRPESVPGGRRPFGPAQRQALASLADSRNRQAPRTKDTRSRWSYVQRSDIRERLLKWDGEQPQPPENGLEDSRHDDVLGNYLTRASTLRAFGDEPEVADTTDLFSGDILSSLRSQTSALLPGDLVEIRFSGGRLPVLGICLRRHKGYQWFYLQTGEVLPYQSLSTPFTVVNFVDEKALQPLVDILPDEPPSNPRNLLAHVPEPKALEAAASLQQLIISFYNETINVTQTALHYLDHATKTLAHPDKAVYMTLEQIADRILPDFMKSRGSFAPHALYATHQALHREGWSARPVNIRWHRRNYIYEIQPLSDIELLDQVIPRVRKLVDGAALRDNPGRSDSLLKSNDLGRFILKARVAIEASRTKRQWTPHGMIGPSSEPVREFPEWTKGDLAFIRFMELWACQRLSPTASQVDSLASTILRLTEMYKESDFVARWTGFTFLQEIGWIPPWEIPARYEYRFPDTTVHRGQALARPPVDVESAMSDDIAAGVRKDWGNARVFCVDSAQTADVDDGFSVEKIDKAGDPEYWIHIHIADPSSRIDPKSALAAYFQDVPSSLYLAGFPEKMMPPGVEQQFSLNPGVPALSFSARVNDRGEILEHKVEPGTIHNVVHMTKEEVTSVLPGGQSSSKTSDPGDVFIIGAEHRVDAPTPVKKITAADELSEQDKDDLALLHRLGQAMKDRRVEKGQLQPFKSRFPSIDVSMGHITAVGADDNPHASVAWVGDPVIKLSSSTSTQADLLVERMMHTVGEVAAHWCRVRNIPAPFSTQPEAVRNAAELAAYRLGYVDPITSANRPLPSNVLTNLFGLIGTSELSSNAAPFYSVGVDAYAKASSPLRRYTDLIVHWQIHAALAEERRTGTSLEGTDCSEASFLPWTRAQLDPLLPMLQARQRQIREVDNRDGPQHWLFQALLRAWKFGEAPLPETMTFEVTDAISGGVRGRLTSFFNTPAMIPLNRLPTTMRMADVRPGDLHEVRIMDINTVTLAVEVELVDDPGDVVSENTLLQDPDVKSQALEATL